MTYQPLKEVNPVPFEESLPAGMWDSTALLDIIDERNGWMDTEQLMRAPETESKKRGWAIALLAAAAVAVIAIGTIVLTGSTDGDLPPATDNTPVTSTTLESAPATEAVTPTTEALQIVTPTVTDAALSAQDQALVEGMVAAFNSYDEADLVSFFAPDASIENSLSGETDLNGFVRELPWRWAMNEQWEIVTCEQLSAISCTFSMENDALSYRFGAVGTGIRIEVADGSIVDLVMNENMGVIGPTLQPLYNWLDTRDPDLRGTMVSAGDPGVPRLDQQSVDLWLELLPIYKAEAGF